MHAMCPRDIAKLMYSLGRVQVGDREFAAAAKPHILSNLDNFTFNVRFPATFVIVSSQVSQTFRSLTPTGTVVSIYTT